MAYQMLGKPTLANKHAKEAARASVMTSSRSATYTGINAGSGNVRKVAAAAHKEFENQLGLKSRRSAQVRSKAKKNLKSIARKQRITRR